MLGISESVFTTRGFMFAAAALAVLAAAFLLYVIVRLFLGRKIGLPRQARPRVPRLGIIDAFDLDGHRQLVIVRRDNIEHLLMIGGPNDLVVESHIIRTEGRESREARLREKEWREEPRDAPSMAQGLPLPVEPVAAERPEQINASASARTAGYNAGHDRDLNGGGLLEEPVKEVKVRPEPASAKHSFFQPSPRRAQPSPALPSPQERPGPREARERIEEAAPDIAPAEIAVKKFGRTPAAAPFFRSAVRRRAPVSKGDAWPQPASEGLAPEIEAPQPAKENVAAMEPLIHSSPLLSKVSAQEAANDAVAEVDTLEAEMAKLLGRRP
ncbi:MAG TPA: hypothetical protein VEK34_00725 [Methylocella sp.]|nr:hypothetical protein [Methylocella sp.]